MAFWMEYEGSGEIEVSRLSDLLAAWRHYGAKRRYRMTNPLTDADDRKLPSGLRKRLQVGDEVAWLERLFTLEDLRSERSA